jgi:[protein-PII] uridylyltransferase
MRKIEAVIEKFKLKELEAQLDDKCIEAMIVSEIKESDAQKLQKFVYSRGKSHTEDVPKVKVEFFADEAATDHLIEKLQYLVNSSESDIVASECLSCDTEDEENLAEEHEIEEETMEVHNSSEEHVFYWKITGGINSRIKTVAISLQDAPGLLSKISGVFTLNGFDILSANKYRQKDDALNILKVRPAVGGAIEDWEIEKELEKAKADLRDVLEGQTDLAAQLNEKIMIYRSLNPLKSETPHRVIVDNNSSALFSVIKVSACDFPGFLFSVTNALFSCGLDVRMAKISTKGDQVEDIFYVKDFDGQKVDSPDQILNIKSAVNEALEKLKVEN